MVDLGPIKEDVQFSQSEAESFASSCTASATLLDDQIADRSSWESTALEDFQGHFAEVFRSNAAVRAQDATNLASSLRKTAKAVRDVAEEARKEQERRQTARDWASRHDDWWEKTWDFFFGEGDLPPQGAQAQGVTIPADSPSIGARETPASGSGGGPSSGYSSAKPENLRSFADSSQEADSSLSTMLQAVNRSYDTFRATCKWGGVDADGVIAAFGAYISANANDEGWARTVADAFARAGGEGNVSTLPDAAIQAALEAAGVAASREPLSIENPTTYGMKTTTGYADDPVNTATGLFVEPETDLALAGGCDGLTLSRVYNSADHAMRAFGVGWSSIADSRVCVTDEGVSWRRDDGRVVLFPRLGDGWDHASGEPLWIRAVETVGGDSRDGGGASWVITDNAGGEWRFARDGLPLAFRVAGGAWVRCIHDGAGHLVSLVHERGRAIALRWDAGHIVGADVVGDAASAMAVRYTYDDAGRLVHADRPGGERSYGYGDNGLISTVTDADGVVEVTNTYDAHGRISTQRSPFGRTSVYSYLAGGVTVVADPDGSRANTWIADQQGRCTGIVDSNGERQSISYDQWGNPAMVTERDGSTTLTAYDKRGRIVRRVTPEGADLRWTWDGRDRITSVTTGQDAVTLFDYASPDDRNPSSITDPTGGITRLEWHDGLLKQLIDPTGVPIRFEHDRHGDLTAIIDADGNASRLEHDRFGRVIAAVTPMGHRTEYTWDDNGHLAARKDPDGAIWRYGHTAAGRPTTINAPDGAVTTIEYGEHGGESRTIDPLGRSIGFAYDDLGNIATIELPDGSQWQYLHDALSRLMKVTAPDGGVWQQSYDTNGMPTSITDPTGVRQTFVTNRKKRTVDIDDGLMAGTVGFDPLGRPVKRVAPDDAQTITVYDRCGRPVELLDPNGGLTLLRRDAAGRVIARVSPSKLTASFEYDRCGRLSASIDEAGLRTTFAYDADGRLVSQTLPSGDIARASYDACGRMIELVRPGIGVSRWSYDRCGRIHSVYDTWNGLCRFAYDAAGQVAEVINALGGITRYGYDDMGRIVSVTDPMGGTSTRRWNALGKCVSATDPLGRETTAGYDAAGRQLWQRNPDGSHLEFVYDKSGRVAITRGTDASSGASSTTRCKRDMLHRTLTLIKESSAGASLTTRLVWNPLGLLTEETRDDGRGAHCQSWTYDADGRRTSMTFPDGSRADYGYDAVGRLVLVRHTAFGTATFSYDDTGRLSSVAAGDTLQTWRYRDGWVSNHTVSGRNGAGETLVSRDGEGRILGVTADGVHVAYAYDAAGQLVSAVDGTHSSSWAYDANGRIVSVVRDNARTTYAYDVAGQLLHVDGAADSIRFSYDASGRRVGECHRDGRRRRFGWSDAGFLGVISDAGATGRVMPDITLATDALGRLSSVNDAPVWWDTAADNGKTSFIGGSAVLALGVLTGANGTWSTTGWRQGVRSGDSIDPWLGGASVLPFPAPAMPGPVSNGVPVPPPPGMAGAPVPPPLPRRNVMTGMPVVGASGGLSIAGLEWMGARVYDATTRGFLSVDPLDAPAGCAWAANPYEYAGNNPLSLSDATGLKPVTDAAVLDQWAKQHTGAVNQAGSWLKDNWEYVAGGAMVVAGGVMIATGVGGPVGMALIGAGADTIIQKATTGEVDWGQVAISGAMGALGGAGASWVAKMSVHGVGAVVATASVNGVVGAGGGAATYLYGVGTGKEQFSGQRLLGTTVGGGIGGAVSSLGAPAGGSVAKEIFRQKANGVVATVTGKLVVGAGGFTGSVVEQQISTGKVDYGEAAQTGIKGVALDTLAGRISDRVAPSQGTTTLKQMSYFGTRTPKGAFNFGQPNTRALWSSAVIGAAVGSAESFVPEIPEAH